MEFDTLTLSRIQFAANISFHILFPTINIALSWVLLYFKIQHNRTADGVWMRMYRFWVKIFALSFALGVVSGITMSFQFGTNWPGFMETVGNVAGPLLGYEVLTAFFLEATFLGIMLFGMRRVPNWLHTLSIFFVAFGVTLSAFWILVLNSWMQTPQGYELIDGVVHVTSWREVVLNPTMPYQMTHMLTASALTVCFMMAGISAYRMRHNDEKRAPRKTLKIAVVLAAVLAPLQLFIGDLHGLNTLEHRPDKVAAMEGLWHTEKGAPLVLFGIPNAETQTNDFAIEIPKGASLILTHSLDGELKGISDFEEHPPVAKVFYSFRIMVGVGMLMIVLSLCAVWKIFIRRDETNPRLLWCLQYMTYSGWVATLAGWYVAEIGRQPWLVTGVLRTRDAVTPLAPDNIAVSLTLYLLLYVVLTFAYIYTIREIARRAVAVEEIGTEDNIQGRGYLSQNLGQNREPAPTSAT